MDFIADKIKNQGALDWEAEENTELCCRCAGGKGSRRNKMEDR